MTKIPVDILRDAGNIAACHARVGIEEDILSGSIARALNKERQRCLEAVFADDFAHEERDMVIKNRIAERINNALTPEDFFD